MPAEVRGATPVVGLAGLRKAPYVDSQSRRRKVGFCNVSSWLSLLIIPADRGKAEMLSRLFRRPPGFRDKWKSDPVFPVFPAVPNDRSGLHADFRGSIPYGLLPSVPQPRLSVVHRGERTPRSRHRSHRRTRMFIVDPGVCRVSHVSPQFRNPPQC